MKSALEKSNDFSLPADLLLQSGGVEQGDAGAVDFDHAQFTPAGEDAGEGFGGEAELAGEQAFVIGFLGTALPRLLEVRRIGLWECVAAALAVIAITVAHALGKTAAGDAGFALLLAAFAGLLVFRARKRRDTPPPAFVLVFIARRRIRRILPTRDAVVAGECERIAFHRPALRRGFDPARVSGHGRDPGARRRLVPRHRDLIAQPTICSFVKHGLSSPRHHSSIPDQIRKTPPTSSMKFTRAFLLLLAVALPRAEARGFFEESPVLYSATEPHDPMTLLARDWERGENLILDSSPLGFLRGLLEKLGVPEESQVLVFSKTSHQNRHINPQSPRALYFSDDTYVGYVQGGDIEVIACDPELGPIFHLVGIPKPGIRPQARRDASCLSCHATANTENVPGMLVRSVIPAADGRPILSQGSHLTTHASPLEERWGGWYVTGTHEGVPHMGNTTAATKDCGLDIESGANWRTLAGKIDTSRYLRPASDIVALMVLEHQCRMHNLLTKAGMEYRRAVWLSKIVNPEFDESEPDTTAHRVASSGAEAILREMLFVGEAKPGPYGVEGDPAFQKAFLRGAPVCPEGKSLRDFRMTGRMFQHRCSYMIHSKIFAALPEKLRGLVHARLREILTGQDKSPDFAHLGARERAQIAAILDATHPQWRK